MNIENNILKYYLRNVMFITGTAYAGKSTMAYLLAKKYDLIHCGENYHSVLPQEILTIKQQPCLSYFSTKKDWQEFVNRTPEVYNSWFKGAAQEASEIEIAELIHRSQGKKIIVDTNISIEDLAQIADYRQIAIMLSPECLSVEKFFERNDPEKNFIREQIMQAEDPQKTMENFKACIAKVNSKENYDMLAQSGFFTLVRSNTEADTRQEMMQTLADHFGLTERSNILICTERLQIRPFEEADFEQFKALLDLHSGWKLQKSHAKAFFQCHLSNYEKMDIDHSYICFGIFEKDTEKLIGYIGINKHKYLHIPELGYGILEPFRGKGYAKEAARGTLRWVKSYFQIPSLVGTAAVDNLAARKVLEYCGFTLEEVRNIKVHKANECYNFAIYKYVF